MKALAKLALRRDNGRDSKRDIGHETAPILSRSGGAASEPQRDTPWAAELVTTPAPGERGGDGGLALLTRAEAAGTALAAAGDRLRMRAQAPPDPALLHALAGAKTELLALLRGDPDALAERLAIMAEPRSPALGTPERWRLDRAHKQMVAGLMRAANAGE